MKLARAGMSSHPMDDTKPHGGRELLPGATLRRLGMVARRKVGRTVRRFEARGERDAVLHAERARILDGAHLWLTIAPASAGVLVTCNGSGDPVVVGDRVPSGPHTVCLPLAQLPGFEPGSFPLYYVTDGTEQRIIVDPSSMPPTKAPHRHESKWRYELVEKEGTLTLVRRQAPPCGRVTDIGVDGDMITVRWRMPEPTTELHLVADGSSQTTVPVHRHGMDWYAELPGDLAIPAGKRFRLKGGGASPYPLQRDRNVFRRPDASVSLPTVAAADGGRLVLRWSRDAVLVVAIEDTNS